MDSFPHSPLVAQLRVAWPPEEWSRCHVLVAVSGGADSVALLRGLHHLRQRDSGEGKLYVAHFNHRLRGEAADADQQWVAQLAQRLGIEFLTERAPTADSLRSEEAARRTRYEFLTQAAGATGARYVAMGHTADDQIETVLLRIFRGTGLAGLAGIPAIRPLGQVATIVRPMLAIRRHEVEQALQSLGQEYRTDASNAESSFTRNWVRNELLPLVRAGLPYPVDSSLLRLASQAAEWQAAITDLTSKLTSEAIRIETSPPALRLHLPSLAQLPSILVQEGCRQAWRQLAWPEQQMTQGDWQRLASASERDGPLPMLPGGISSQREGEWLVVTA